MLKTDKRLVVISGSLLSLKVGESAVIYHGSMVTRTSAVASIQTHTRDIAMFETRNSRYCVVPVPGHAAAMRLESLPACA